MFYLVHIISHFFQGNLWHQILQTDSARLPSLPMSQWLLRMVRKGLQAKYTITRFSGNGQRMRTNIVAIEIRPSFFKCRRGDEASDLLAQPPIICHVASRPFDHRSENANEF